MLLKGGLQPPQPLPWIRLCYVSLITYHFGFTSPVLWYRSHKRLVLIIVGESEVLVGSCSFFEIFSTVHVIERCQSLVQNLPRRSLHVILSWSLQRVKKSVVVLENLIISTGQFLHFVLHFCFKSCNFVSKRTGNLEKYRGHGEFNGAGVNICVEYKLWGFAKSTRGGGLKILIKALCDGSRIYSNEPDVVVWLVGGAAIRRWKTHSSCRDIEALDNAAVFVSIFPASD